jgi:hypothetical protein
MSPKASTTAVLMCAVIALCPGSSAQIAPGTTSGSAIQSGSTVLLGNPPSTPVTTFAAPPATAGISNAGRAGISNSDPLPGTLPGQRDTVVYFSQPGIQPVATMPAGTPAGSVTTSAPAENATEGAAAPRESGGRTLSDFGPSYYVEALPQAGSVSVGEIAAEFKARKASNNPRVLSNQDVQQMLGSKAGVTVAKNMPPLGPGAMPAGPQAGSSANAMAQPSAQTGQSGTASSQTGQSSVTQKAGTPPPAESSQQPTATAGGSTTPAVNPSQQSNDAQGKSKLPATATILPLLGLLGAVSGGIGLWFTRFRK